MLVRDLLSPSLLLIGRRCLIRTSIALAASKRGFHVQTIVLLLRTSLSGARYASAASVSRRFAPGASACCRYPASSESAPHAASPTRFDSNLPFNMVVPRSPAGRVLGRCRLRASAAPAISATFRTPLLRGRDFADADTGGAPGAVIVNEAFARRFWPGRRRLAARAYGSAAGA